MFANKRVEPTVRRVLEIQNGLKFPEKNKRSESQMELTDDEFPRYIDVADNDSVKF